MGSRLVRTIVHQFDARRQAIGGIDTAIRELIEFAPTSHEFRIIGVDAVGDLSLGAEQRITIRDRDVTFVPVTRLDPQDQSRRRPHTARLLVGLARHRPALSEWIQAHRVETGAVLKTLHPSRRLIQMIHGEGPSGTSAHSDSVWRFVPGGYRLSERVAVRAERVVVFSNAGAERLSRTSPHVRGFPTWFNPRLFFRAQPTNEAGPPRLLWAGRLEAPKDPLLALRALASSRMPPEVTLTVAGTGSLRRAAERLADELNLRSRTRFVGPLSRAALAKAMRQHDVFLLTSRFEGFPRVLLEALASGCRAVVVPNADPAGVVTEGYNGARCSNREPASIADAVGAAVGCRAQSCADSVAHMSAPIVVGAIDDYLGLGRS